MKPSVCIHTHTHTHAHMHTCTHTHTHAHMHTHTGTHTHSHTCTHTHAQTQICTHTHTNTHKHADFYHPHHIIFMHPPPPQLNMELHTPRRSVSHTEARRALKHHHLHSIKCFLTNLFYQLIQSPRSAMRSARGLSAGLINRVYVHTYVPALRTYRKPCAQTMTVQAFRHLINMPAMFREM